jgi:hypothetical protein
VDIPADVLGMLWPGRGAELLCEELSRPGLVADYRLDFPGPRVRLHDVMRSYLRGWRPPAEHAAANALLSVTIISSPCSPDDRTERGDQRRQADASERV